jgi:hypothetical protein
VTYGNGAFEVVGLDGEILSSPDGKTWTSENQNEAFDGVAYGNGTFVVVGSSGAVLTSPDGVSWISQSSGVTNNLAGVTYSNGNFVVVGSSGTILTSPDGKTWASETSGTTSPLNAVCYNNNILVAVGNSGAILQETVSGQTNQSPSTGSTNQSPSTGSAPVTTPGEQLAIFTIGQTSFFLDGQSYNTDAAPFISNGRTLVPVRYLADALGATTNWDGATQKVTINKGSATIELTINGMTITTNGKASQMEAAPLLVNGRTYLPARDIAEALGYTVEWDAASQTVNIIGEQ